MHLAQLTTVQKDAAAARHQAFCFDHAAVIDHAGLQGVGAARAQDHRAGRDLAAVVHQGVQRGTLDRQGHQAVAAEVQGHLVARAHQHLAGSDTAFIAHHRGQQGHHAALGLDLALVDHAACPPLRGEAGLATHEVSILDVQAAGHQAADIDLRAFAEDHAIGVDQPNLAVSAQLALNLSGGAAGDAVERDRLRVGLSERDLGLLADIELLPVQDSALALLLHRQLIAVLRERGLAAGQLRALGQGVSQQTRIRPCPGACGMGGTGQQDAGQEAAAGALAAAFAVFCDGHIGAGDFIPNQAIGVVHGGFFHCVSSSEFFVFAQAFEPSLRSGPALAPTGGSALGDHQPPCR